MTHLDEQIKQMKINLKGNEDLLKSPALKTARLRQTVINGIQAIKTQIKVLEERKALEDPEIVESPPEIKMQQKKSIITLKNAAIVAGALILLG